MGRGRAKAKQTKVARRLKYYSPDTDLTALERELRASEAAESGDQRSSADDAAEDPSEGDPHDDDNGSAEDGDDEAWASGQR